MTSIVIFNLESWNFKTKKEYLLSYYRNRKSTKKHVSFLIRWLFWNKPFSGFLGPHNLESSIFLRRCEYVERGTPSKNILEFLENFSSRSYHKLFFWPPCIKVLLKVILVCSSNTLNNQKLLLPFFLLLYYLLYMILCSRRKYYW